MSDPTPIDAVPPERAAGAPSGGWRMGEGEPLAWLASLTTHALLLVLLATTTLIAPIDSTPILFSTPEPLVEEPLDDAFRVSEEMLAEVGAMSEGGLGDAAAAAPNEALVSEVSLEVATLVEVSDIPSLGIDAPILNSPEPDSRMLVRGVGAVGVSGSSGAVDRLTGEVLLSLAQRPTLVVWLFDRSASLAKRREEIVGRFDRVYEELGVAAERGAEGFDRDDAPLLTAIGAFAKQVEFLTPEPTDELESIKSAVRSITQDDGGEENVFSAILETVERYKRHRLRRPRRNVLLVVVTDEAGDDPQNLDRCVEVCRKMQTPVYVVGAPAPFGRQEAFVRYVDPDPEFDQTPQWLPVRQGPESLMPERLRLGSIGRGDFDGPTLDSGFGPFGLTRLTAETGGFYISVHPFRVDAGRARRRGGENMAANIDYFFDERLMRRYRPDYVPTKEYRRRLDSNGARAALVDAAALSWTAPLGNVRREFPKLDEARFVEDLSRAQRAAAILEPQLERLVGVLRRGERDRDSLDSPRWQAGFDLAMGRALAAKVRAEGYNAMLAAAKSGLSFKDEKSDTWRLAASNEIATGSSAQAEADAAREYLQRVVEDHQGTPWALLAQRELSNPLGWRWSEEFRDIEGRQERQRNRRRNNNRPRPEMKQRRPPPKL